MEIASTAPRRRHAAPRLPSSHLHREVYSIRDQTWEFMLLEVEPTFVTARASRANPDRIFLWKLLTWTGSRSSRLSHDGQCFPVGLRSGAKW